VKASTKEFYIGGNIIKNCVSGVNLSYVSGSGFTGGVIAPNTFENVCELLHLGHATGLIAHVGTAREMGAFLADGVSVVPEGARAVVVASGCVYCDIKDGRITSVATAYVAGGYGTVLADESGGILTQYNRFANIVALSGFSNGGIETAAEASDNLWDGVVAIGASPANPSVQTGSQVIRRTANGQPDYRTPILFDNGSAAAPMIARSSQTSTGMFFATNKVGWAVAGTERLSARQSTVYAAIPTYADDAAATVGGLTAGELYKTVTGEVRIKT
jgi:hypothetical protein